MVSKGTFLPSYFEIGPVISDKMIFKVFYIAIKPYPLMAIFSSPEPKAQGELL